jgi:hypothetical protein
MPQQVDDPATAKPTGSRKDKASKTGMGIAAFLWGLIMAIKAKIEGWISDPLGALDAAQAFITEHGWEAAAIGALLAFIGFKIISNLTREDYEEGRATPSGEVA